VGVIKKKTDRGWIEKSEKERKEYAMAGDLICETDSTINL